MLAQIPLCPQVKKKVSEDSPGGLGLRLSALNAGGPGSIQVGALDPTC